MLRFRTKVKTSSWLMKEVKLNSMIAEYSYRSSIYFLLFVTICSTVPTTTRNGRGVGKTEKAGKLSTFFFPLILHNRIH
jgi:hypothetical protein